MQRRRNRIKLTRAGVRGRRLDINEAEAHDTEPWSPTKTPAGSVKPVAQPESDDAPEAVAPMDEAHDTGTDTEPWSPTMTPPGGVQPVAQPEPETEAEAERAPDTDGDGSKDRPLVFS